MKQTMRIAKWLACVFGGASAASFLTIVLGMLLFGLHDTERTASFLPVWTRVGGVLGAAIGAFIVFRSEKRVTS